uniref:CSON003535 protein n=1 Tax=Culicoides sonorensis TaxID=179676 RepID=A0A336MM12_CULSO
MEADSDIGFGSTQSDDEDILTRTDNIRNKKRIRKKLKKYGNESSMKVRRKSENENILIKLKNREAFGYFSSRPKKRFREKPFKKIPAVLSFCLKDIIPCCFLEGHIFMGLTACGQFLLSYKVRVDDEVVTAYDFSTVYRYELFFWIYRPHNPLHKYFSVCLFDDHGIDGIKKVTMTQWSSDSAVLIINGESDTIDSDSYITYVRVPKLGCLDCRELRGDYFDASMPREAMLCIRCALMIHLKYRRGESAPKFMPEINLNCPGFVMMNENTFIHVISVDLEMSRQKEASGVNNYRYTPISIIGHKSMDCDARSETVSNVSESDMTGRRLTIADEIIADFEEFETESMTGKLTPKPTYDQEIHGSPLRNNDMPKNKRPCYQKGLELTPSSSNMVSDNGITPLKDITGSKVSSKEKIKLYEFSEENEKCEKISTFRKRRLADKKYEFNEDSFDSILPFNRIRDRIRSRLPRSTISQGQEAHSSHLHRASPNQGFRSPCGSPVGYRFLRSPPGMRSPNYYTQRSPSYSPMMHSNPNLKYFYSGLLSPRTGSTGPPSRRNENNLHIHPLVPQSSRDELRRSISSPIHRPFIDMENNENQQSLSNLSENNKTDKDRDHESQEPWKKLCSKKFTRRFVEEDDATSVITTTEEDDCISPGYHTSLPLEVHGACYSNMQPISRTSCSQLKNRPIVYITQNTFDTESLTVCVATFVCKQNNKVYDMLSDSTYNIINVCPISSTLTCVMKIEFFANDAIPESSPVKTKRTTPNTHKYQLRTLFTWNINDGMLNVLDYGKLVPLKGVRAPPTYHFDVNGITEKFISEQNEIFNHLRILRADVSKSKQKLSDMTNMIEFYRKNNKDSTDSSFSDTSTMEEEQQSDNSSEDDSSSDA